MISGWYLAGARISVVVTLNGINMACVMLGDKIDQGFYSFAVNVTAVKGNFAENLKYLTLLQVDIRREHQSRFCLMKACL